MHPRDSALHVKNRAPDTRFPQNKTLQAHAFLKTKPPGCTVSAWRKGKPPECTIPAKRNPLDAWNSAEKPTPGVLLPCIQGISPEGRKRNPLDVIFFSENRTSRECPPAWPPQGKAAKPSGCRPFRRKPHIQRTPARLPRSHTRRTLQTQAKKKRRGASHPAKQVYAVRFRTRCRSACRRTPGARRSMPG